MGKFPQLLRLFRNHLYRIRIFHSFLSFLGPYTMQQE